MILFSSIPRSGSTLLSVLLRQRPDTHVSHTSHMSEVLGGISLAYKQPISQAEENPDSLKSRRKSAMLSAIKDHYSLVKEPIIFDKCRAWTDYRNIEILNEIGIEAKVIATVRPMAECVVSGMQITGVSTFEEFLSTPMWFHMMKTWETMRVTFRTGTDNLLLVEYKNIVSQPQKELDQISDFIGVERFVHQFDDIAPSGENDLAWGIPDLHKVDSTLSHDLGEAEAKAILGSEVFNKLGRMDFWSESGEESLESDRLLDLQLNAGISGQFEMGQNLADQLEKLSPDDPRVTFNRGWYELRKGNLLKGHMLLDAGRSVNAYGNNANHMQVPLWDGVSKGKVLLSLEGGLGDQISGLRFVKEIKPTVIACSKELWPIINYDAQLITSDAGGNVDVDYWVPSMSAVVTLGLEYKDLIGSSYINRTAEPIKGRVGVRWSGNPQFEHEQHRVFPSKLMFDAVKDLDCVSLQRDEGLELKPDWMPQADVTDWVATRKSISECELVITSCTSIAHLSGAMGVETWIVVPILPYYLWALPINTTPYYDSVTLFRQEKYGSWNEPFEKIKKLVSPTKIKDTVKILNEKEDYHLTATLADPIFM
jgi:hypothetical protein